MDISFSKQNFTKILGTNLILIILFFLFQCSAKTDIDNVEAQSSILPPNHNIQVTNLTRANKMDQSKDRIDAEDWIRTTAKDFYLQNLKEKKLSSDEIEIRIWSEQDQGTILSSLVLNKNVEKWQANVYSVRIVGEQGEYEKTRQGKNLVNKKTLSVPKSGWENVIYYLEQEGIQIPLPYSWDTQKSLILDDEAAISLELKQGEKYDLISYGEATESPDGKTVVRICNYLEDEFQIKIGCGY